MERYKLSIVGAGPAGIAAVGKVLDTGVNPKEIHWIDPEFRVGDFGTKWGEVSSNTKIHRFEAFLRGSKSFNYDNMRSRFELGKFDPEDTCTLKYVTEPLQHITDNLRSMVDSTAGSVSKIAPADGNWSVSFNCSSVLAERVILAVGSDPKVLDHSKPVINLSDALDRSKLAVKVDSSDVVAVFGSSHSAIMASQNFLEVGVKKVINFYNKPLRYAVDNGDCILYDNTGLKGEAAEWARKNINIPNDRLFRTTSDQSSVERFLPECSKVVYAVGFEARAVPVEGMNPTKYDEKTGVIAPHLFGFGFAFPEKVVDRVGNIEYNVGLLKFIRRLDSVFPIWMNGSQ